MPYGIASVGAVANSGKAIRSEDNTGRVVWFYRVDWDWYAHRNGERHEVPKSTVEANVDHDDTDVETVPVGDSPFADTV